MCLGGRSVTVYMYILYIQGFGAVALQAGGQREKEDELFSTKCVILGRIQGDSAGQDRTA